ncbi:MAG: sigma-70 family RNA polymerase sigma factor [Terriglobales bacterium]
MAEAEWLAERFEENRDHLRAVAYRMLGSLSEADDAVQEAWLKLSRSGAEGVRNLSGWLTTVVARVCLDMLRARRARREEALEPDGGSAPAALRRPGRDPEQEAVLAESVGLALLVVLETLAPDERLAFVLHDLFALPFEEIAPLVGRTPAAARQLASRARRRVRGESATPSAAELKSQREVVEAFLTALRGRDLEGLMAVLDPEVVVRADGAGAGPEVRGARTWAQQAITAARGARFAQPALVDGAVGLVVAPQGRLFRALHFTFKAGKIAAIEVVGAPERLRQLELAVLE